MSKETESLIQDILKTGQTKTMLAQQLGVSYDEVDHWFWGRTEPTREQITQLEKLLYGEARLFTPS